MAMHLHFPVRGENPLEYLGALGFICFVLLGVTGILLQVYYVPEPSASFDSVARINNEIPYGFELRNLHYWLSNLMIALAIAHLFYLYFKRKYTLKNEILWTTGMLAGLLTIVEAYTGYSLVMNTRSVFATEIGIGILRSVQPALANMLQGTSLADTIMRMFTLHIVMVPAIIAVLFLLHFPRRLTVDAPVILATIGAILVIGGAVPADLGSKFVPAQTSGFTIPEWYLTGVYALLRSGVQVFIAAVVLPSALILVFLLIPFIDRKRTIGVKQRAVHAGTGLTALVEVGLLTIWGYRGGDLLHPIELATDLPIAPPLIYGTLTVVAVLTFTTTFLLTQKVQLKSASTEARTHYEHNISKRAATLVIPIILLFQVALIAHVLYLQQSNVKTLPMMESGLSVLGFATTTYLYRVTS
jgi:ubiquinol-cytochrome c reductase cytochrome b subunit